MRPPCVPVHRWLYGWMSMPHVCVTVSVDSLCRVELPHVLLCLGHVYGGQAGSCMVGEGLSSRDLGGIQSLYSAWSPPSFLPCLREE